LLSSKKLANVNKSDNNPLFGERVILPIVKETCKKRDEIIIYQNHQ